MMLAVAPVASSTLPVKASPATWRAPPLSLTLPSVNLRMSAFSTSLPSTWDLALRALMLSVEPFWRSSSWNTTKEAVPSRLMPVLSVAPSATVILSKVIVPSFVNVPPAMVREPVLDS